MSLTLDPIDGPIRRFKRAKVHLDYLKAQEAEFLSREPYSTTTHYDPKRKRYRLIVHVHADPDPDLGLIAAECIHNLRAGLDNLMWSIVPKNVRNRRLQFPIHDDPIDF